MSLEVQTTLLKNVRIHARLNNLDPREDDGKGDPIKAPRNIVTNPGKKGKTQTVFFDSQVWEETEKYPEPYHDPGKIAKMNGKPKKVKVRKKKGEEAEEEAPPSFFPAVTKWARYKGVDTDKNPAQRFGNPYPYFERKLNTKKRKIRNKDGTQSSTILQFPFKSPSSFS